MKGVEGSQSELEPQEKPSALDQLRLSIMNLKFSFDDSALNGFEAHLSDWQSYLANAKESQVMPHTSLDLYFNHDARWNFSLYSHTFLHSSPLCPVHASQNPSHKYWNGLPHQDSSSILGRRAYSQISSFCLLGLVSIFPSLPIFCGKEKSCSFQCSNAGSHGCPSSPWRFSSSRTIEGLVAILWVSIAPYIRRWFLQYFFEKSFLKNDKTFNAVDTFISC